MRRFNYADMFAPKKPDGLEDAIDVGTREFLITQLDTICQSESEEARDVANTFFCRCMEQLYERGIANQYTTYYEELYKVANHVQGIRQEEGYQNGR